MISAQVSLSAIFLAASANIYSEPKFEQKSLSARQLDEELTVWKSRLPQWLNPDVLSFKEPEWISKQKLALQIRKTDWFYRYGLLTFIGFHHIRAFIHRPFLSSTSSSGKFDSSVSVCLLAARATIDILYSAFAHRHYIRSWWYNAAHILYSNTILLHLILLDNPSILSSAKCGKAELIEDVNKSLQILRSMDQMVVAVRYADLLGDILEVVGPSPSKMKSSQAEERSTQNIRSNISDENSVDIQGPGNVDIGGNSGHLLRRTTTTHQPQHSSLSRDDVLASLMNQDAIDYFHTPPVEMMFGVSEGWNVAGNVFSDFTFTGENNDAAPWDWEQN
jgi:hypothetical protein